MGYMRHHAIIVTASDEAELEKVRNSIVQIMVDETSRKDYTAFMKQLPVTAISRSSLARTVRKEGWVESDRGNAFREQIVAIPAKSHVDWAEVQYGDEERDNRIISCSGGVADG